MTREEAREIINRYGYSPDCDRHFSNIIQILNVFEKLGLLKFDDNPAVKSPSLVIKDAFPSLKFTDCDKIVNALMDAGYVIVRK